MDLSTPTAKPTDIDRWISRVAPVCAAISAEIDAERAAPAQRSAAVRARDAELRAIKNFHRTNLTLSCGCEWSFVSYRFHNECAAHHEAPTLISIDRSVDVTDGGRYTAD